MSSGMHSTISYNGRLFSYSIERDAIASIVFQDRAGVKSKTLHEGIGEILSEGDWIIISEPTANGLRGYLIVPFIDEDCRVW